MPTKAQLQEQVSELTEEIRRMNSAGADIGKVFAYGILTEAAATERAHTWNVRINLSMQKSYSPTDSEEVVIPVHRTIEIHPDEDIANLIGEPYYLWANIYEAFPVKEKMEVYTLDEVKDEVLGEKGTEKRDNYETELAAELAEEVPAEEAAAVSACAGNCPMCNTMNCERFNYEDVWPPTEAEEVQEVDPRYVTWSSLLHFYEESQTFVREPDYVEQFFALLRRRAK